MPGFLAGRVVEHHEAGPAAIVIRIHRPRIVNLSLKRNSPRGDALGRRYLHDVQLGTKLVPAQAIERGEEVLGCMNLRHASYRNAPVRGF